jgi:transcriptional regulator with XRE-family HTH domain
MKKELEENQIAFLKAVGKNIAKYRKEKGWSQQELGYRCNIDKPHVSRAESGAHNFSILMAQRISDGLQMPVSKLFEIE